MDIKTKFAINDIVYTIDATTMKVKKFAVNYMTIHVTASGDVSTTLWTDDNAHYDGEKCFFTEDELIAYIESN